MNITLSFDLHAAGPRRPADADTLWLALKIASAYDAPVAGPDQPAALPALMPWSLLPGAMRFRIVGTDLVVAVEPSAETAFVTKLRERIAANAAALAASGKLSLGWARDGAQTPGEHVEEGDEEEFPDWPWLGLSSSIAALPATLSRPLRARWLIPIDGDTLSALRAAALDTIVLAPESVHDANRAVDFALRPERTEYADGRATLVYQAGSETIRAFSYPLPARFLLDGAEPPPIASYWLDIDDSRADTLADVDRIIAENADPVTLAALVPGVALGAVLKLRRAGGAPEVPLPEHVAAVAAAVTRKASAIDEQERIRAVDAFVATLLAGFSGGGVALAARMRDAVTGWWAGMIDAVNVDIDAGRLALPDDGALGRGDAFELDRPSLDEALKGIVDPIFKADAAPLPTGADEAIDFIVGSAADRLVAEDKIDPTARSPENEMAELGLLVRRATDHADVAAAPWRMVSAGYPLLDPDRLLLTKPWGSAGTLGLDIADTLVARGIALAFKDGVLRNDDSYRGRSMIGPDALSHVHRESAAQMADLDPAQDLCALAYVSGAPRDLVDHAHGLAPPLRYGDYYALSAFLIDRAGGLPDELSRDDDPTMLDPARLATLAAPAGSCTIEFKRRFPLDELNVKPLAKQQWPAIPSGVALRASEWLSADRPNADAAPALLLSERPVPKGALPGFRFTVEPPRIDEQTLQRWALPPTDADPTVARTAIATLQAEYARIAIERLKLLDGEDAGDDLLPHDPSVWGIGYVVTLVGPDGVKTVSAMQAVAFEPVEGQPFLKKPLEFRCTAEGEHPSALTIDVPAGHFAILDISLLVTVDDDQRFDADVLGYRTLPVVDGRRVHPGVTILIETMTGALPDPHALHDAFSLGIDGSGRVIARVAPGVADLAFVDRYEIDRQRWAWRNLPNVPASSADPRDTRERRLARGLPFQLSAPQRDVRDTSEAVLAFDAVGTLDHSFVTRPLASGRWPRDPGGAAADGATLLIDDRDGQAAADYLRYRLRAISRYAPLLAADRASVLATPRPAARPGEFDKVRGAWRRIAVCHRGGDRLRALNILAVLPLTAHPRHDPATGDASTPDPESPTPFFVILDEVWFREYGPGEALRAELALEDREIGEDPNGERPLRFGPMPHKHILAGDSGQRKWTDARADDPATNAGLRLDCFGPFGYSLDRSGNQALANATAFIVYPPDEPRIGPHWSMTVRFRRVLHGISSDDRLTEIVGPASGNHLLYTLADSARLVRARDSGHLAMWLDDAGTPTGAIRFVDADIELAPYRRSGLPVPAVLDQYRYVLLLGPLVFDGGRGVEAFLPSRAFWLRDGDRAVELGDAGAVPHGPLQGQVIEIELSGGCPVGTSPIDKSVSLRDLFDRLLPKPDADGHSADAPGRVTRVSPSFEVRAIRPLQSAANSAV